MNEFQANFEQTFFQKHRYLIVVIVALIAGFMAFALTKIPSKFNNTSTKNATVAGVSDNYLVSKTNEYRTSKGLPVVQIDEQLTTAAYAKARDMAANNYFEHISPSGKQPWDFIKATGYKYSFAGENLAIGFDDLDAAFDAWLKSDSHRTNIVNKNYTQIGIAVAKETIEGKEQTVIVQLFATPQSAVDQIMGGETR